MTDYREALDRPAIGVVYPCFCTRRDIQREIARAGAAPHGQEGPLYPGTCRPLSDTEREVRIAAGDAFALRLDAGRAAALCGPLSFDDRERGRITVDPVREGDVVLARKDIATSYHLAVVVDDALQGVTCVTRGEDLLEATHPSGAATARPAPPRICAPFLAGRRGRQRFANDKAKTIAALREEGYSPAEVRVMAGA